MEEKEGLSRMNKTMKSWGSLGESRSAIAAQPLLVA
jgi:hypothetical protein